MGCFPIIFQLSVADLYDSILVVRKLECEEYLDGPVILVKPGKALSNLKN
jgi:hypothetical protein